MGAVSFPFTQGEGGRILIRGVTGKLLTLTEHLDAVQFQVLYAW